MKKRESGQGLVEYALILVLVAIAVIALLALLGEQVKNVFCRISEALTGGDPSICDQEFVAMLDSFKLFGLNDDYSLEINPELDEVLDKVDYLGDQAINQEDSIYDGLNLAMDSFEIFIDIFIKYSEETNNLSFLESLSQLKQDVKAGYFEEALENFTWPELVEIPHQVIVDYIMETSPTIIDSCVKFNSGYISSEIMGETKLAVEELDESQVGKTEALDALKEAESLIEARNGAIVSVTNFQSEILNSFISRLEDLDEEVLAAKLTADSEVCVIP